MVSPVLVARVQQRRAASAWVAAAAEAQRQIMLAEIAEKQKEAAAKVQEEALRRATETARSEAVKITLILAENDLREREQQKIVRQRTAEIDHRSEEGPNFSNGGKEPLPRLWFVNSDFSQFNVERARLVSHQPLSGNRRLPLPFTGVGGDIPENSRQGVQ